MGTHSSIAPWGPLVGEAVTASTPLRPGINVWSLSGYICIYNSYSTSHVTWSGSPSIIPLRKFTALKAVKCSLPSYGECVCTQNKLKRDAEEKEGWQQAWGRCGGSDPVFLRSTERWGGRSFNNDRLYGTRLLIACVYVCACVCVCVCVCVCIRNMSMFWSRILASCPWPYVVSHTHTLSPSQWVL